MVPSHSMDMSVGWWFIHVIGFFIFMMLACFLFRWLFRGGAFCCAARDGRKNSDSDDPVGTPKSRHIKGEIGREENEQMRREIREEDRKGDK